MGALDGMLFSNSYYFEKYLGWKGLLIEGSPALFKKLKANRPDSITMNAMVCAEERNVHWIDGSAVGGVSVSYLYLCRFILTDTLFRLGK